MTTNFHTNMTCIICTGIGIRNNISGVLRKKNLGLLAASHHGHKHCADIFIREGANVNCTDHIFPGSARIGPSEPDMSYFRRRCIEPGWTPIMFAAENGHLELVNKLIKAGADVNVVIAQMTALRIAARKGHYKCCKSLVEAGANVNITHPLVMPPLMCAIRIGDTENSRTTIEMLIKAGADVNIIFSIARGTTNPLVEAVQHGTPHILSMLIDAGANVNLGSFRGTPLFVAASKGKIEFIKPLVEAGADVNRPNEDGKTALHGTLLVVQQEAFGVLMELGADVNIADKTGVTPLMLAAKFCFYVQDIIWKGCRKGEVVARKNECINRICRLFKAGAEIGRVDHLGRNSLQVSFQPVQKEVKEIQMLLYAAGETLDGPTGPADDLYYGGVIVTYIPKYFTELKEKLDLKHLCREATRKYLIDLDPHKHLFGRIPHLGLPSVLIEYMLYGFSLDPEEIICDNSDEIMNFP